MLAMGRALMARPKVLLLDEPSMGLSPIMVDKIFEVVADIHGQRHHRPAGRAERQPRAAAGRPRLRDGVRRDHDERRGQAAAQRPEGARGLPGRVSSAAPCSAASRSAFAPDAFTTLSYLASSPLTKAANCSGVVGEGSASNVASRALISGEASASMKALFSRCVVVGRQAGRAEQAEPGVDVEGRQAVGRAGSRRSSAPRASRWSAWRWSSPAPCSLPLLMLAEAAARLSKFRSTWPDSSASCAGRPAGVGDVHHVHAGLRLEHLAGQVPGAAVAAGAVVQRAGVLLRVGHQVGDAGDAQLRWRSRRSSPARSAPAPPA